MSLEFWRYVDSSVDQGEYLRLDLFDGGLWNTVREWTDGQGDDDQWHAEVVDLSGYSNQDFKSGSSLRLATPMRP